MKPTEFVESGIRLSFDASKWTFLIQYDAQTDYKKIQQAIEKTKAVDFIGILNNSTLSFIEALPFRNKRIKALGGSLNLRLRQKMTWLTPHVMVTDSVENLYSDSLTVQFLPIISF